MTVARSHASPAVRNACVPSSPGQVIVVASGRLRQVVVAPSVAGRARRHFWKVRIDSKRRLRAAVITTVWKSNFRHHAIDAHAA